MRHAHSVRCPRCMRLGQWRFVVPEGSYRMPGPAEPNFVGAQELVPWGHGASATILDPLMNAAPLAIDLPAPWTGSLKLEQTPSGAYVGMARLSLGGVPRCVLVITPQLSWEAAMERVRLRASHFVSEWTARPRA